ncbi:MAG TPA: hypothetical protein V6C86_16755 [Oculatellaceae cyanobacterium]
MCSDCNIETVQNQLDWIDLKMPDVPVTSNMRARASEYLLPNGCLCKRTRIWTKVLMVDETGMAYIPAGVGGTIIFEDVEETLVVRWDNSLITMHQRGAFLDRVYRIGQCATLSQYYLEQHQPQTSKPS